MNEMENLKQPALSLPHLIEDHYYSDIKYEDAIRYIRLKRQYALEEDTARKEYLLNEIKECKNKINSKYKFGENKNE